MTAEDKNYYEVLEIPTTSTFEDINKAYSSQKNAYTGDGLALYSLLNQDDCRKILEQVEEAYTILSDPEKRRQYDKNRGINTVPPINNMQINANVLGPQESILQEVSTQTGEINQVKKGVKIEKLIANKRFSLQYNIDDATEKEIEQTTVFTGDFLKRIREYKNVPIIRMAEMTKVSKTYLQNIEEENIDNLPALVYVRGFVYQYAKCLKLNPDIVASSFLSHIKEKYHLK